MATFVFAYRMPNDFAPGRPDTVAAWTAWFEGMGANLADQGKPVLEPATLGYCGDGTRLGGYSLVTADDLETALAVAKGCPALHEGAGIEVGMVGELSPRTQPA